jgi:hypothetical protein
MDIVFPASWRQHRQIAGTRRSDWSSPPSGVGRLLLALAVIAAIVALLDHAAGGATHACVASTTLQTHQGEPG